MRTGRQTRIRSSPSSRRMENRETSSSRLSQSSDKYLYHCEKLPTTWKILIHKIIISLCDRAAVLAIHSRSTFTLLSRAPTVCPTVLSTVSLAASFRFNGENRFTKRIIVYLRSSIYELRECIIPLRYFVSCDQLYYNRTMQIRPSKSELNGIG